MPRTTITDVLFDICLTKWTLEEWTLRKELRPPVGNDNLATCDDEELEVVLYPHDAERHPPLEQTLLHELIHIGLDLDGLWDRKLLSANHQEHRKRGTTYWLEKYLWRRLTQTQKGILTGIVAGGG